MGVMLDCIEYMEQGKITDVVLSLVTKVNGCLVAGNKQKLPSAAQASVWSTFHQSAYQAGLEYMAGYVAVNLLRKYKKPSKHPTLLQAKQSLFVLVCVQKGMGAVGEPDSSGRNNGWTSVTFPYRLSVHKCTWLVIVSRHFIVAVLTR